MSFRRRSSGESPDYGTPNAAEKQSIGDRFYEWRKAPHGRERATKGKMLGNRIGFLTAGVVLATAAVVPIGDTVADTAQHVKTNYIKELNNVTGTETTIPVTTVTVGEVVTSALVVCPESVRVEVTDPAVQTPELLVAGANPDITDPALLAEVLGAPFNAINDPFDPSALQPGQFYFMPAKCFDPTFGG